MSKKLLNVGDRVNIYDAASYTCPMRGVVTNVSLHTVDVRTSIAGMWSGYQKQVRKIRPPKAKPERERIERVERRGTGQIWARGNWRDAVEIHEGEQVISREALAAAWGVTPTLGTLEKDAFGFAILCKALGFPVSTKGEGA